MDADVVHVEGRMEVTCSGNADQSGFERMHRAVLDHRGWQPGMSILIDHTHLNSGPLTVSDIEAVVDDVVSKRNRIGRIRCAFVVSRDLEYGLVRMWIALVAEGWDGTADVFRSREDAIDWLISG